MEVFLDMIMESVLLGLKETSHVLAQLAIFCRSELIMSEASVGLSTIIYKNVSSANRQILLCIEITMLLIKIVNNRGPKIEPCGTPALSSLTEDEMPFLILLFEFYFLDNFQTIKVTCPQHL